MTRITVLFIATVLAVSYAAAREWRDTTGKFSLEAELVWHDEKSVVLEKPDGSRVHVEMAELRKEDVEYLASLDAPPTDNTTGAADPDAKRSKSIRRSSRATQGSSSPTTFGQVRLNQDEIDLFVQQCSDEKAKKLEELQKELNAGAEHMTPAEIIAFQEMFRFVSRDNVLFVPRLRTEDYSAGSRPGVIFKPTGGGYSVRLPYANAETVEVIDRRSAFVKFERRGPVILEGIDTRQLPAGTWKSSLLLKYVGTRKIPGVVGDREIMVIQAVSGEGFPDDIVLW